LALREFACLRKIRIYLSIHYPIALVFNNKGRGTIATQYKIGISIYMSHAEIGTFTNSTSKPLDVVIFDSIHWFEGHIFSSFQTRVAQIAGHREDEDETY
jgi:hypothetical protein